MGLKLSMLTLLYSLGLCWNATSTTFYKAFGSESLTAIDKALTQLNATTTTTITRAYRGALMMKKSNYIKGASKKIELFKAGSQLLDAAIQQDPSNAEYRFIRLTIQENAPKILRYNKNMEEDKRILLAGYKKMTAHTRSFVLDYAQKSRQLEVSEFK